VVTGEVDQLSDEHIGVLTSIHISHCVANKLADPISHDGKKVGQRA
jgi:hypothetical protein